MNYYNFLIPKNPTILGTSPFPILAGLRHSNWKTILKYLPKPPALQGHQPTVMECGIAWHKHLKRLSTINKKLQETTKIALNPYTQENQNA